MGELLALVLLIVPICWLGVLIAKASPSNKGASGCGAMFAAGAFVLIPQGIAWWLALTVSGDNYLVGSAVGAVVGILAAYGVRWFLMDA